MARVFSVGDCNVDLFTHSDRLPEFGEEGKAKNFYAALGGNAANFAAAIAGLGIDTWLVSVTGSGLYSDFIARELRKAGVGVLSARSALQSGVSNIFVRNDGERAISSVKGCLLELDCSTVEKKIIGRIGKGDIVFFGGFFHLPRMRKGFAGLLEKIRARGAKIFFDATFDEHGKWGVRGFLRLIDVFFLNEVELRKITRLRDEGSGIKKLLAWGAKRIALKKGGRGASFYSGGKKAGLPALPVKAVNATGAGDFFNAGFTWGALNGYGWRNCLLAGNFVAGKKIGKNYYFVPGRQMLESYLKKQNLLYFEKTRNYAGLSGKAAGLIVAQLKEQPDSVLCLAAGETPVGAYAELVRARRKGFVDFSKARLIQLDEYLGLAEGKKSFRRFLEENLLEKTNFRKKNVFFFDSSAKDSAAECKRFDALAKKMWIDFCLLGIGQNSHIAFNEPGTSFDSNTHMARITLAMRKSRKTPAGAENAFTLGMRQIMSAKKIVLIASGRKKALAVRRAMFGKKSAAVPASILQGHRDATVICDAAASRLIPP